MPNARPLEQHASPCGGLSLPNFDSFLALLEYLECYCNAKPRIKYWIFVGSTSTLETSINTRLAQKDSFRNMTDRSISKYHKCMETLGVPHIAYLHANLGHVGQDRSRACFDCELYGYGIYYTRSGAMDCNMCRGRARTCRRYNIKKCIWCAKKQRPCIGGAQCRSCELAGVTCTFTD